MSKYDKNKIYRSFIFLLFCMLMFTALYGCGPGQDSKTTPGSTTTTTTGTASLTLSLPSSVTYGTPVTVTGTLRDGNGALVPNTVVTFAASSGLVTFVPTSATVLTNGSGIVTILLNAADITSDGATSITASASVTTGGTTATVTSAPAGISVGGAAVTLGTTLTIDQPSISAYGTSMVHVPVLINSSAATIPVQVEFSSPCVAIGKATLTSPVTSDITHGIAYSTYKDNGCGTGSDTITASEIGRAHV
jgi:hypothetical protein